jgi:tetratricopeptide (TPR) repeat protein
METCDKCVFRAFWVILVSASLLPISPALAQTNPQSTQSRPRKQQSADPDELARKAESARTAGRTKEALNLYQEVLRARPTWSEGWWYVGMIHYDSDQFAEAILALKKVVQFDPNLGPGWAFLGLCEFSTAKYSDALVHLDRASTLGFGDAATARVGNYHRALILNMNGKFRDATEVLSSQFRQEKLTPQIAIAMGLALLRMPILPAQLDVTKKELVFAAGQASVELKHRRFEEALQLLTAIEKEHPDVPYVHYSAAEALFGLRRWDEAESQLRSELQLSPKSSDSYVLLARIKLKQNSLDDALQAAKQAESIKPDDPQVHYVLSECFAAKGLAMDGDAELAIAKKLGWQPNADETVALSGGTSQPGITTQPQEIERLHQKAMAARESGDAEGAIAAYREALQIQPDWIEGLLNLSTLYYTKGQTADALNFAGRLAKLQPNVGATWALIGLCEFQMGDYENALVHLKRGRDIGFPPGSGGAISEANYHIGVLLNLKGDFGAAHDILAQEVKGDTERADDAKYALGINLLRLRLLPSQVEKADQPMVQTAGSIAMDLSKSDYGPATVKFDELLKAYPGRGYIHDAYGWTLMSISRYDAAAEQYRQETRLSPKSSEAYLGLATAALKIHNYVEARDASKKAVELAPDSAMAHGQYGRALVELSNVDGGIKELEKAVQLAVAIPELHFSLSRAYAKANRPKDAERERQVFLRLNQQQQSK